MLRASSDEEPWGDGGYVRFGRVHSCSEVSPGVEKLVLSLDAEASRGWPAVPELHLTRHACEEAAGDAELQSRRPLWHVIEQPRAVLRGSISIMDFRPVLRQREHPALYRELVAVPLREVPLAIAKFDVRLQEKPSWAVRAQQTILTRMVMSHCNWCTERFQLSIRRTSRTICCPWGS